MADSCADDDGSFAEDDGSFAEDDICLLRTATARVLSLRRDNRGRSDGNAHRIILLYMLNAQPPVQAAGRSYAGCAVGRHRGLRA